MIKLEKLVVQGFKSFKRKVAIPFNTGFSVITGPNGSGKTNISEAIYFVLGIGSSQGLRAKRAHEVIFHGSPQKDGADFAKVGLFLDNSNRLLPFDMDSVSISRRVNKGGVSTYRLNGKVSTKQEALDILALGGVHATGHNMIKQGDVTRIIESSPIQRRQVIDEIAGITEYDEKKEKAMKELAKVDEKIREAEIVLQQKDEILEKLQKDRDTAMEYKKLQRDLEMLTATSILKNLKSLEKRYEESKKGTEEKVARTEAIAREIKDAEKQIEAREKELEGISRQVMRISVDIEKSGRASGLRSRIEMKKERIKLNSLEIERINEMIERLSVLEKRESPAAKAVLGMKGVVGTFSELVTVPPEYKIAVEVAAGSHLGDVVTENHVQATECIKYLKEGKIGRARFLPMDKLAYKTARDLPRGAVGWMSDLVQHNPKYRIVINFVLGSTVCVRDIDRAKELMNARERYRIVTLDGDLVEPGGAMTGGFYRKGSGGESQINAYTSRKKGFESENETLMKELGQIEKEFKSLGGGEEKVETPLKLEEKRSGISQEIDELRKKRDTLYEERTSIQEQSGRVNVLQARYEAGLESAKADWEKYKAMQEDLEKSGLMSQGVTVLDERKHEVLKRMEELGPVNMKSITEFDNFRKEFDDFKVKVDKIAEEKHSIEKTIADIEKKKRDIFTVTMEGIDKHFKTIYNELTGGDASLKLEEMRDMESGLMIYASPPGKKLLNIDAMSTGEKTLTAFSFLFAIQNHKPAPFYVLDEADASLDKTNTVRLVNLIRKYAKLAQFIIISHNDHMIKGADQVYGISMEEGESKVIGIKLPEN